LQTAPFAIIGDFGIHFQYGVSLERFQANNGKFGMECIIMFEALGDQCLHILALASALVW
jgi:hypothetical protein